MRGIYSKALASTAMALAIGAAWGAPALAASAESEAPQVQAAQAIQAFQAGQDTESAYCSASFSRKTVVREIPYANSTVLGEIPAGEWADGAWCVPFTTGGKHTTCGSFSDIWLAVAVDDTWGFAHVGCLQGYYID